MKDKNTIIKKIKSLKNELSSDGVSILGIFGSLSRDDWTEKSDIDILYEIKNPTKFAKKYDGFGAFSRLAQIKEQLSKELESRVDLVAKSSLNKMVEKHIFRDLISV